MVDGSIVGKSPCECSILPMSPKEARRALPRPEPDTERLIERADERNHALCVGCGTTFPLSKTG